MNKIPSYTPKKNHSLPKPLPPQKIPIRQQLPKINYQSLASLQSTLKDQFTFTTYMKAIKQNTNQFHNKIVMHLTTDCNCFYSILASQAGARKVYCVLNGHDENQQKNLYMMQKIISENGFNQQEISVMLYRDFKIDGKIDIIIGQPMGWNLIYDGMLDRIIQSRDLYLNPNTGLLLPDRLRYKCALIWDEYQKDQKMQFWNEVHGVSMKEMKKWVLQEPIVRVVDPTLIVSEVSPIFQFNLYKIGYEQIDQIKRNVQIKPTGEGRSKANGLTVWFEVDFTLADGQRLTIDGSPWSEETRWLQTTLYVKNQWELEKGVDYKIGFHAKKNHNVGNATIKLKANNIQEVYLAW